MIDGLKPYPAMKDSGVPWLGEVPEHWEVRRLGDSTQGCHQRHRVASPMARLLLLSVDFDRWHDVKFRKPTSASRIST